MTPPARTGGQSFIVSRQAAKHISSKHFPFIKLPSSSTQGEWGCLDHCHRWYRPACLTRRNKGQSGTCLTALSSTMEDRLTSLAQLWPKKWDSSELLGDHYYQGADRVPSLWGAGAKRGRPHLGHLGVPLSRGVIVQNYDAQLIHPNWMLWLIWDANQMRTILALKANLDITINTQQEQS